MLPYLFIYGFCKTSEAEFGKIFVVNSEILTGSLRMTILAVLCSDPVVSTILSNRFYHFSECAFVTSSRAEGFCQASWLDLRWRLYFSAARDFHSWSERSCPQQSHFGRYYPIIRVKALLAELSEGQICFYCIVRHWSSSWSTAKYNTCIGGSTFFSL